MNECAQRTEFGRWVTSPARGCSLTWLFTNQRSSLQTSWASTTRLHGTMLYAGPSSPILRWAQLGSMIYAFPTFYGGIGEAVGAYGRGLSTVLDPKYHDFEVFDALSSVEDD
jgi:hypothetical protein